MKTNRIFLFLVLLSLTLTTCGSNPNSSITSHDELDMILREVSDYLNESIQTGRKIAFINIQSSSIALTEYIFDTLIANAVNDKIFSVVDRQQLETVRTELDFNTSGEVSDQSAQSVGKMLGAQTIITGRISQVGERYRLNIRALEVETVQVQGSNNWNISAGPTITALMRSTGGSSGGIQATARTITSSISGSGRVESAAINDYEEIPEGAIRVNNVATWNTAVNTIRNGGNNQTYIIHVTGNISIPTVDENIFGYVNGITVTILGSGTISPSTKGNLLRIRTGQTIIVKNVTLRGLSNNNNSVIRIMSGGIFRMEGNATVRGNTGDFGGVIVYGGTFIMLDNALVTSNSGKEAGGVIVSSGIFIMQGNSSVTANKSEGYGSYAGGVYVNRNGTFTMENGMISGNNNDYVNGSGGGVHIRPNGTFTMKGGTISGNTTKGTGGGVYVYGTFIMQGGMITGGNTARRGGGVYVNHTSGNGTFTKTSGIITGSDKPFGERNIASEQGHALYISTNPMQTLS